MPETDLLPEIVIDDTADGYVETDEEPQSEEENVMAGGSFARL